MNGNDRTKYYLAQGYSQKEAFEKATADVIKWAQENGLASNKPTRKKAK
jgi:phosphopantetheinyl transferase (holo-ACP synthase)